MSNPTTNQILARRLLENRDRGYSFSLFLRRNGRRYLLLAVCFALALFAVALIESWGLFYGVLGMFAGCILRDIGWVRNIGKTWPFSLEVTDWDKVRSLADEKGRV